MSSRAEAALVKTPKPRRRSTAVHRGRIKKAIKKEMAAFWQTKLEQQKAPAVYVPEEIIPVDAEATHYAANMRPRILFKWAERAADVVTDYYGEFGPLVGVFPVFVYRGSSGIAAATALSQALVRLYDNFQFGMVMVRKEGEQSHGMQMEVYNRKMMEDAKIPSFVFVDDFIASGSTFHACIEPIEQRCEDQYPFQNVTFDAGKVRILLTGPDGTFCRITEKDDHYML